jgi:hypothetical protein
MGRTLRLRTLNLAQQSERRTFHSFTFKDLRMRKTDSLLLLRQALGPDVPSDQMQLPPGVVQVVRAPVQLLLQTLDFGLRGGEIKLWTNGRQKHRVARGLTQALLDGWTIDGRELPLKGRSFCFKCRERDLCV